MGYQPSFGNYPLSAGVSAHVSGGHHAMTGNDEGHGIAAICLAYGTCTPAGLHRDLRISSSFAEWNGSQGFPNPPTIRRALRRYRQLEQAQLAVEVGMELVTGLPQEKSFLLVAAPSPIHGDDCAILLGDRDSAERRMQRKLRQWARLHNKDGRPVVALCQAGLCGVGLL